MQVRLRRASPSTTDREASTPLNSPRSFSTRLCRHRPSYDWRNMRTTNAPSVPPARRLRRLAARRACLDDFVMRVDPAATGCLIVRPIDSTAIQRHSGHRRTLVPRVKAGAPTLTPLPEMGNLAVRQIAFNPAQRELLYVDRSDETVLRARSLTDGSKRVVARSMTTKSLSAS